MRRGGCYNEEEVREEEEMEEQYKELKERMEDFQSHLERFKEETKDNLNGKEGVDLEEVQRLLRRNE